MPWRYEFFNDEVRQAMALLDDGHKADLAHFRTLIEEFGLQGLTSKQSEPFGQGLAQFRLRGYETIARVFYCTKSDQRIVFLRCFIKKTAKTPQADLAIARERCAHVKEQDAAEHQARAEQDRGGGAKRKERKR